MIEKILDDAQRWTSTGLHFGHIAINSCAADFTGDGFGEFLLEQIRMRNISPRAIELEVTEGVFVGRGAHHVARALQVLRKEGVRIALDDFGTGYASLTHLKQFPIDSLKVDRSFVSGITRNVDDAAIVRAVLGLAKNLGIETVAEGVETLAQAAFVRHHGCDFGQGYLYGAAMSAADVEAGVARRAASHAANSRVHQMK
jgi:EAL domain-containing protein (putative c-di-GMP-specific phosphodiesterase class I)